MRLALISDIHGNLVALETVLSAIAHMLFLIPTRAICMSSCFVCPLISRSFLLSHWRVVCHMRNGMQANGIEHRSYTDERVYGSQP